MNPDLQALLAVPSKSGETYRMYNHLREFGIARGWKLFKDDHWNLYAVKGSAEVYPCVVCHIDTVHHIEKGGIYPVEIDGNVTGINPLTMEQTGIGGDDKCGIWAALHCLEAIPACKAVFFVDEERGCIGSGNCNMTFFDDCRFILQADRRGNEDFVDKISGGPLASSEFLNAVAPIIEQAGYKRHTGMMTDVMKLRDNKVGISAANMSAGYYNPHLDSEFISLTDLDDACLLMENICRELTAVFPFVYTPPPPPPNKSTVIVMSSLSEEEREILGDPDAREAFPDWEPYGGWADANNGNGQSLGQSMRRCAYCDLLFLLSELMRERPEPVCIDCEIYKDEHGIYPVSKSSSIWRNLVKGRRRHKKKRGRRRSIEEIH